MDCLLCLLLNIVVDVGVYAARFRIANTLYYHRAPGRANQLTPPPVRAGAGPYSIHSSTVAGISSNSMHHAVRTVVWLCINNSINSRT